MNLRLVEKKKPQIEARLKRKEREAKEKQREAKLLQNHHVTPTSNNYGMAGTTDATEMYVYPDSAATNSANSNWYSVTTTASSPSQSSQSKIIVR